MRGEQDWCNRAHNDLVSAFREFVHQQRYRQLQEMGRCYSPEETIRIELRRINLRLKETTGASDSPVALAWDVLAYDRYEAGSIADRGAGEALQFYRRRTHEPAIKLSHPLQVRIIDALTEAVGIPHERGQAEIDIPEKLEHYFDRWLLSNENLERVAKARAKRNHI